MRIFSRDWIVRTAVIILVICSFSSIRAQWIPIHTFPDAIHTIYFLDREGYPNIGFVGLPGQIWRTSDRGSTWTQVSTPTSLLAAVKSFSFKDSLTGWCAVLQDTTAPAVYKTTDAGITWNNLSPIGEGTSIYYNLTSHALILSQWNHQGSINVNSQVSTDEGTTWAFIPNTGWMTGVSFTSALNGIMSVYRQNNTSSGVYSATTDGGITWTNITESHEAWQPIGVAGTNTYYSSCEGSTQFQQSVDGGNTWTKVFQFNAGTVFLTGDVRGDAKNVLYVQTKDNFFASTDQGASWFTICGPGNDFDTRFFWASNDMIWAGEFGTNILWYNPYGVKNNDKLLQFSDSAITLISNGCQSVDSVLHLLNFSTCPTTSVQIQKVEIFGAKKLFTLRSAPYDVASKDSIVIRYTPDDALPDSARLDISYTIGPLSYVRHIFLKGKVIPGFQAFLSNSLSATLASGCNPIDTIISVTAGSCDSVHIDSLSISGSNLFSLGAITLPTGPGPGKTFRVPINISVGPVGTYTATLHLTLTSGGVTRDTTILMTATITNNVPLKINFSVPSIQFDSVSTCVAAFDTLVVKNALCKTLTISSSSIQPGTNDYSLVKQPPLPSSLAYNQIDTFIIGFAPKTVGGQNAQLHLLITFDNITTKDTAISITGIGSSQVNVMTSVGNLLQFDTIVECASEIKPIIIRNNGCDSVTIKQIISPTLGDFSVASSPVGKVLRSGDTTSFFLNEQPISSGNKTDSIIVIVQTKGGAQQAIIVHFNATILGKTRKLSFDNLIHLDSLAPCTAFDTILKIKNLGVCDTLDISSVNATGFALVTASSAGLPRKIAPGDSLEINISVAGNNVMDGTATIALQGSGFDTTITIITTSRKSGTPLAFSATDSVFVSTYCNPALETFTFKNQSCNTVVIDSIWLGGSLQFGFVPPAKLPIIVKPGDSAKVIIGFDPSQPGDSLATLTYQSKASAITRTVSLRGATGGIRGSELVSIALDASSQAIVSVTTPIGIDIILQNSVGALVPFNSVELSLNYNTDLLGIGAGSVVSMGGWTFPPPNQRANGLDINFNRTTTGPIAGGTKIGHISFATAVTNTDRTTISISSLGFNGNDSLFERCVLTPQADSALDVGLIQDCGIPTLVTFIATGTVADRISIRPNPLSERSRSALLSLELHRPAVINVSVSNILGQVVMQNSFAEHSMGAKQYELETAALSSGVYIVRIEASGEVASLPLVIQK